MSRRNPFSNESVPQKECMFRMLTQTAACAKAAAASAVESVRQETRAVFVQSRRSFILFCMTADTHIGLLRVVISVFYKKNSARNQSGL